MVSSALPFLFRFSLKMIFGTCLVQNPKMNRVRAHSGCDVDVREEGPVEVQVSVVEEDAGLVRFSEISSSTAPDIEEEVRYRWRRHIAFSKSSRSSM